MDESGNIEYRQMTVARIRESKTADHTEVVFLESARFYKLVLTNPQYKILLERLQHALEEGRMIEIRLATPHGDIIEDVKD